MRGADQRRERKVLLHGDAGLRGEILGRHEIVVRSCFGVPTCDPGPVQQRAIKALAGFGRDAAIAERAACREHADVGVRLVDLDRNLACERMDRLGQSLGARDRLLDEQDRRFQPREPRLGADPAPQGDHRVGVLELLVAVERCEIGLWHAVEHRGDARQPIDVGVERARDLELEMVVSVGRDHLLQAFGQAVVEPLAGGFRLRQRIDQPDRVAREDRWRRRQVLEERVEIEAREVGRGCGGEAKPVGAHELEHRRAFEPAERVDDRPLDERKPERRDEAVETGLRAGRVVRRFDRGGEAEGGIGSGSEHVPRAKTSERRS